MHTFSTSDLAFLKFMKVSVAIRLKVITLKSDHFMESAELVQKIN